MTFEYPAPEQLPILQQLWKTAFGDTEEFLSVFFSTAYSPLRCRIARENGETLGMLYWFDVTCREQKMAYLYAVATHPKHRGKGVCRRLMEDTHALLRENGYAGALLVPQTEALRNMYSAFGYRSCITVSETFCAAGSAPAELHRIDAQEFARLRRESLPEGGVIQEGENLRFLEAQAQFYRGANFLLAALPAEENTLFGAELLGCTDAAPAILKSLGYGRGTFRTPGEKQDFAMFLPLREHVREPSYFGFPFD